MAAYAVIARIERANPHLAGWTRTGPVDAPDRSGFEPVEPALRPEIIDRPFAPGLAERWADFREVWAQTTFFLLHADGWR